MPIPDDTREFIPGDVFDQNDNLTQYWIKDGIILHGGYPIRGAHIPTFRFFLGGFAKDQKHCYCYRSRLKGGNGETFRALNYCYATDGHLVWTIGGKVEGADAETFAVCDDGAESLIGGGRVPNGYGKDKVRVYYYDFDGKPNWVRKATANSFVSLNDACFGKDHQFVFCGAVTIPKAKVDHWKKIGGHYSKDDQRIYYFNREIRDADYDSFEVIPTVLNVQLAKDKGRFYQNDTRIDSDAFTKLLDKYAATL